MNETKESLRFTVQKVACVATCLEGAQTAGCGTHDINILEPPYTDAIKTKDNCTYIMRVF